MDLATLRSFYKDRILAIAAANKVTNVRIFGSVARGDAGINSDVDFLVTLLPEADLFDLGGLYMELRELLDCEVDVVPDGGIDPLMRPYIMQHIVAL